MGNVTVTAAEKVIKTKTTISSAVIPVFFSKQTTSEGRVEVKAFLPCGRLLL
jgi:hypothetical protein